MKRSRLLIRKIISPRRSILERVALLLGGVLGLLIMILSLQLFRTIHSALYGEKSIDTDSYKVINKRVDEASLIRRSGDKDFTTEEVEELREIPWVEALAPFSQADYSVYVRISVGLGLRQFSSQLFFEAIPEEYLDIKPKGWHFDPEDPIVPIILPRDYLSLYNFGFAPAQGLPIISSKLLDNIPLEFILEGAQGQEVVLPGRIAGLSDRINTILVPEEFLSWSNAQLSPKGDKPSPKRLILKVNPKASDKMQAYLTQAGYEVMGENELGRLGYLMTLSVWVVLFIGVVISLLSMMLLALSILVFLERNTRQIDRLLLLGYPLVEIERVVYSSFFRLIGFNTLIASTIAVAVYLFSRAWLLPLGITPPSIVWSIGYAILIELAVCLLCYMRINSYFRGKE